jgi:hypothetical protein
MCITRIIGIGINSCQDPKSNQTSYNLVYPGRWTLVPRPNCGGTVAPRSSGGTIHPDHNFSSVSSITYEGCNNGPDPEQPCDCVNGGCVPQMTYGTPGVFPNLAACQSGCAKNSNCTGECIDPAEIAALQQAAATLQAKICK